MNSKSNLHKSLKKAFEEHTEPLLEVQWERLDAALGHKKYKRKLLPWIFGFAFVAGFSVVLYYTLYEDTKAENTQKTGISALQPPAAKSRPKNLLNNEILTINAGNDKEGKHKTSDFVESDKSNQTRKNERRDLDEGRIADISPNDGIDDAIVEDGSLDVNKSGKNTESENSAGSFKVKETYAQIPVAIAVQATIPNDSIAEVSIADTAANDEKLAAKNASDTPVVKVKDHDSDNEVSKRFAIGFTYGLSQAVYKDIVFTDAENMHMDTRNLYNESVSKSSSVYTSLFFDIRVLKKISLTFNSGIQYRQVRSEEDITYKYNQLPFRDIDGSIVGYFYRPDSLNPTVFHSKSINTISFMSIPLALSYTYPIGTKNELQITGGVIMNRVRSVKGSTLSVNDNGIVDIGDKYSGKISFGYLGGLAYFRQIYKPWWLGLGVQWQQNKTSFNASYGYIESRIGLTNLAFSLKYKF